MEKKNRISSIVIKYISLCKSPKTRKRVLLKADDKQAELYKAKVAELLPDASFSDDNLRTLLGYNLIIIIRGQA